MRRRLQCLQNLRTRRPLAVAVAVACCLSAAASGESPPLGRVAATNAEVGPQASLPVDGFGLDEFVGAASIAAELRRMREASIREEAWALDMAVSGPGGAARGLGAGPAGDNTAAPSPLKAMLAGTVSGIDVSAGIDADPETIRSGPARWIGGVKVATEGRLGRAELAVRTSVRYAEQSRRIGLELGPRFERAFPGGLTFFMDGKAEAESAGSASQRIWTPTMSSFDGLGSLGLVGRTGIVR